VLLGVALAFEVPVFVLALVRLRILTAAKLRSTWRIGVFAMTVIGVLLPGVDPVSTILSVIPLVGLYVLSIGLASFLEPRWRSASNPAPLPE
jgi:sec-independent protein translocase protein TatC